jgi:hypothetical protein
MTPFRVLALILGVVLLVTAATPARAEAMEMTTILLIASVAGAIVIVIAYLIVANMSDRRQAGVPADGTPIGGTAADGTPIGGTPVAVASYVVAPAPVAPAVQGQ